jgi:hypothetical protein
MKKKVRVRAKQIRKWMTLSDCANGAAGVGSELFGRRPPNVESMKRMRKAAGGHQSVSIILVSIPPNIPAKGVRIRIMNS